MCPHGATTYVHKILENNCQGPVLIRVFLYMKYQTEPLRGHTEPLRAHNSHNHCATLLENNCWGPVLIRVSSYMKEHTEPLRGQTHPHQHPQSLCDRTGTQLSESRVNKGFPLYERAHRTTSWADKTTHNTHNHCVTELEHNCQGPVLRRGIPLI